MINDKQKEILRLKKNIFSINDELAFKDCALALFRYQYEHLEVYRKFVNSLNIRPENITELTSIPFLPISFFKSHQVCSENNAEIVFESSGTTGQQLSKHYIYSLKLYERNFIDIFQKQYGDIKEYCIIGLLPTYLERHNSSLLYMADGLIKHSGNPLSGFYLNEFDELRKLLVQLKKLNTKTILIGVTFALLYFSETLSSNIGFDNLVVMETGGMKGKRQEMVRDEVHEVLKKRIGVDVIHSEYGMTELLSQAYSKGNGIFESHSRMKVMCYDLDDPLITKKNGSGGINIIDLANLYSCSFIQTHDLGKVNEDGSFEVLGRFDHADIRGCNLLIPSG